VLVSVLLYWSLLTLAFITTLITHKTHPNPSLDQKKRFCAQTRYHIRVTRVRSIICSEW